MEDQTSHEQLQASGTSDYPAFLMPSIQIDYSFDSNSIVYCMLAKLPGIRIDDQSSDSKIIVSYTLPKSKSFEQELARQYLTSFPPGYDFNPSDSTLILHYLIPMINSRPLPANLIHRVNIYKFNPNVLTETYPAQGVKQWYFFTSRDRKYRNGGRPNRKAGDGYWKATGADKPIMDGGKKIGFRKALVFYQGRPPNGQKTSWIMHEFKNADPSQTNIKRKRQKDDDDGEDTSMRLDDFILCRMYKKEEGSSGTSSNAQQDEDNVQEDILDDIVPDLEEDLKDEQGLSARDASTCAYDNSVPYNAAAPNITGYHNGDVDAQINSTNQVNNVGPQFINSSYATDDGASLNAHFHINQEEGPCYGETVRSSSHYSASTSGVLGHMMFSNPSRDNPGTDYNYSASTSGVFGRMMFSNPSRDNPGTDYNYFDTYEVQQTPLVFYHNAAGQYCFLNSPSPYRNIDDNFRSELPPTTKPRLPSSQEVSMPMPMPMPQNGEDSGQNHLISPDSAKDPSEYSCLSPLLSLPPLSQVSRFSYPKQSSEDQESKGSDDK